MATIGGTPKNFLKNRWHVAEWDYDINERKILTRTILEKPAVLHRGQDTGSTMALDHRYCTD